MLPLLLVGGFYNAKGFRKSKHGGRALMIYYFEYKVCSLLVVMHGKLDGFQPLCLIRYVFMEHLFQGVLEVSLSFVDPC